MDPTVQKLMDEFGMSRELAEQTARNLSQEGTAAPKAAPARGTMKKTGKAVTPQETAAFEAQAGAAPPSIDPAPVQYKAGPGKSGYTRNETVRVLVNKYGVPPEQAVAHEQDLRKNDPEGVQNEAVGDVAMREVRRLNLMKRYEDIVRAQEAGEPVDQVDQQWAAKVTARAQQLRTQRIQQAAGESTARREQRQPLMMEPMVVRPNPKTVAGLMNSFGMDQGSAAQLAMQFEGVR
jgi:hypothetical protein